MIRLRKPLSYFKEKYGSYTFGLDRLYLLMEKQHNRGQEAAGIGVVKLKADPGTEYIYRERALGSGAIDAIFAEVGKRIPDSVETLPAKEVEKSVPYIGEIYMGHLRYSTTGRSGLEYTHPFLRRNNWRSRSLLLCGNFNMTNVDEIFRSLVVSGQHPRIYSDTALLLEQAGAALDKENHRLYRLYRGNVAEPGLTKKIEEELDLSNVLAQCAPMWDGGFTICGVTGSGSSFVLRDRHGIRPAFYYVDDEMIVVASERPVIQTVFNVTIDRVNELQPGSGLFISPDGSCYVKEVLPSGQNKRCAFERIYFSRGSDADIYRERKRLGANLVPDLLKMIGHRFDSTVFSFIPNTAEVAYSGMVEALTYRLDAERFIEISNLSAKGELTDTRLAEILRRKVRTEKIAIKDIKLRTFIATDSSRNDLATHVYDITYGCIDTGRDTLVVLDDSIVRGTTLSRSILRILDRLAPARIIVVSSAPQVRYPDYYGIDLPSLGELSAFRAVISLLEESGHKDVIDNVYRRALENASLPREQQVNVVKELYNCFKDEEIARRMARMLTPPEIRAKVDLLFQTIEGLHNAVPGCPGDWYFSGDYPTPGGTALVNKAFIDFYESKKL